MASGKVNAVGYQMGQPDAFYYQYKYDAENKLLRVLSNSTAIIDSRGSIRLESLPGTHTDAEYKYYLHGPLARTEIGQSKVQGVDYAYTVQGWLKGINGSKLDATTDIGEDGKIGSVYYDKMGRDAMAYTLGYHNEDYKPIGGTGATAFGVSFTPTSTGFGANLYNGNISHTTVALSKINGGTLAGYTYKYDQLNRLKGMQFHNIGSSSTWNNTPVANNPYGESYQYDANGNISRLNRNSNAAQVAMDNLKYWYYYKDADGLNKYYDADPSVPKPLDATTYTNKLAHVEDAVASGNHSDDIDGQTTGNYQYDKIGNLVSDGGEGLSSINWTAYGKIQSLLKSNDGIVNISYGYDAGGNRVYKRVHKTSNSSPETDEMKTYYVRDAQGNVLAVYDSRAVTSGGNASSGSTPLAKIEQHLYGSSRLGIWKPATNSNSQPVRNYELTNHLGNVIATISDMKVLVPSVNGPANNHSEADVVAQNDYYPFGMMIKDRQWRNPNVQGYRYGFNGKENDNEIKGEGNQQDYGERIAKFLSVDPLGKKFPELTPYQFASNTPIQAIDLDGLEAFFVHGTGASSKRWTDKSVQTLLRITNNRTYNKGFNWKAPITNGERMRAKAALQLADYVMRHRAEGEEITLVGHSHGGNVAIQAARTIYERTGQKVNIVTISTPAYNANGDSENPETQKTYINDHRALWNPIDGVPGGMAGDDYYTNSTITTNVEINVDKYYKDRKITITDMGGNKSEIKTDNNMGAHSFDVEHPDTIDDTIKSGKLRRLKPVTATQSTPTNNIGSQGAKNKTIKGGL